MDGGQELSDHRTTSPWPVFVALGLATSEVGIVWPSFPLAAGGLFLFGGSVAGILRETGYAGSPWPVMAALGLAFWVLGLAVWWSSSATVAYRGSAIAVAGVGLVLAAAFGRLRAATRT